MGTVAPEMRLSRCIMIDTLNPKLWRATLHACRGVLRQPSENGSAEDSAFFVVFLLPFSLTKLRLSISDSCCEVASLPGQQDLAHPNSASSACGRCPTLCPCLSLQICGACATTVEIVPKPSTLNHRYLCHLHHSCPQPSTASHPVPPLVVAVASTAMLAGDMVWS